MTIQPATVQRDEEGYWFHPDYPKWDEETTREEVDQWEAENNIRIRILCFEDSVSDELNHRFFEQDDHTALAEWEPEIPTGGFLLGIHSTEDHGPVALVAEPTAYTEENP